MSDEQRLHRLEPPRQSKSPVPWIIGGCVTAILLVAILVVVLLIGLRSFAGQVFTEISDTEPMALPTVTVTEEDYADAQGRLDTFVSALESGTPTDSLKLTADDINAILHFHPVLGQFGENLVVEIEGESLGGQVSLPTDIIPGASFLGAGGRYINGKASFTLMMVGGNLHAYLTGLELKGESIPAEALSSMSQQNLLQDIEMQAPDFAAIVRELEDVKVVDGTVVLVPKNATEVPAEPVN